MQTDIWKNFGYGAIVYLAAILGIDSSLYEAAKIDGANRWQQTWHVTLPGMKMIIVLMLVLSLGNVLNAGFDQVFNLYNVSVYESGDILDTFVYRLGLLNAQYGPATAVGLFKSFVSTLFISVSYFLAYKFEVIMDFLTGRMKDESIEGTAPFSNHQLCNYDITGSYLSVSSSECAGNVFFKCDGCFGRKSIHSAG